MTLTAKQFITQLSTHKSMADLEKVQRFFAGEESKFIGIRMATLFALAKEYTQMPLAEISTLLDSEYYEARMGAVCIMDFRARNKKITPEEKKELFDLYITKHDRIDNWDMVDRAAPHVIGGYLTDKPRKILYKLAKSKNVWERRTAIVSTWLFIRQNDLDDTFQIAELLVNDKHELINKAVGSWVREAGKRDKRRLISFLDNHAATMPRTTLRYAIEQLDQKLKEKYMKITKKQTPVAHNALSKTSLPT